MATRDQERNLVLNRWRASVLATDIQKLADRNNIFQHMRKQEFGFPVLTCGPCGMLGVFEIYVRGEGITVKNTISPDDTYTQYVLSPDSTRGRKLTFSNMAALVRHCKRQAADLSNDKDDYETIKDLDDLRAAKHNYDMCDSMGSLKLEDRRVRMAGRRSWSMPPIIDRSTKPGRSTEPGPVDRSTKPGRSTEPGPVDRSAKPGRSRSHEVPSTVPFNYEDYTEPEIPRAVLRGAAQPEARPRLQRSGHYQYLTSVESGAVKKIELDTDYDWLASYSS